MCSPGVALVLSLAPVALRAQAPEGVGCDVRDAQRATRSRKEAGLKKKWCSERNAGRLAVRPMCNLAQLLRRLQTDIRVCFRLRVPAGVQHTYIRSNLPMPSTVRSIEKKLKSLYMLALQRQRSQRDGDGEQK